MENKLQLDIGEEIIMKLKEISLKINKLLEEKNEKELSNPHIPGNRT